MADEPNPAKGNAKELSARERQAKGWANLRPAGPGEVRNPLGINGREGAEAWRKFLDAPDPDEPGFASRRAVMHGKLYQLLKSGKIGPLQIGIEQDQGKPPQSIDHNVSMNATKADEVAAAALAQLDALGADDGGSST